MNEIFSNRRVAILLGLMLILAFLGPATGVATFFYRDFGVMGYPTASFHRAMFWQGELPLWNPYSNCGVPFLAQWGTMTLYPFTLLYLLLPFPWSLNVFCLVHLWFGAFGIYRLAQKWTGHNAASTVAGVIFLFNGVTQSSLYWPNYTVAFGWAPWTILFALNAFRGGSIALAAACGTMQMLSGAPELIILTWFLIGLVALPKLLRPKAALRFAVIIALIAALSAPQLLPFFDLLQLSHRQAAGALATKWALPDTALGSFLLPMLHAFRTPQNTYFQHGQQFLSSTWLGAIPVLLATLALLNSRSRRTWSLVAVSLACVILAMSGEALRQLPFVGLARYPVKFVLLLPLTIPLLAAFGVKALAERRIDERRFFLAAGAVLMSCLGFMFWTKAHPLQYDYWPTAFSNSIAHLAAFFGACCVLRVWMRTQRPVGMVLLVALLAIEGRWHIPNQNPTTNLATLTAGVGQRPLPKLGEGRVFITTEAEKALLNSEVANLDTDFIGKQLANWSHLNLVELTPKVNGSATLQIREQKEIQDWLYSGTHSNLEAWLDFLGVSQMSAPGKVVEWTNRTTAFPLLQPARIIEVTNQAQAFQFVTAPGFDPRQKTLLSSHLEDVAGVVDIRDVKCAERATTATIVAKASSIIVHPQTWSPNWRAEINGKLWSPRRPELLRANYFCQAVPVPSGQSALRFVYYEPGFMQGLGLAVVVLCVLFYGLRLGRTLVPLPMEQ